MQRDNDDTAIAKLTLTLVAPSTPLLTRPFSVSALLLHPHNLSLFPRIDVEDLARYATTPVLASEEQDALSHAFWWYRLLQRNSVI